MVIGESEMSSPSGVVISRAESGRKPENKGNPYGLNILNLKYNNKTKYIILNLKYWLESEILNLKYHPKSAISIILNLKYHPKSAISIILNLKYHSFDSFTRYWADNYNYNYNPKSAMSIILNLKYHPQSAMSSQIRNVIPNLKYHFQI